MKKYIAFVLSILFSYTLSAQVLTDSTWVDNTGSKMHLQQVGGTDSLVVRAKKPWKGIVEIIGINASVLAWDSFLYDRPWAKISKNSLKTNMSCGWTWDDDSFSGNQFSHPYHGSLFYNSARENGMSYGQSMLYPLFGSAIWELFCENNKPAINDVFSTGIGGSAIGEATHRASDLVFDNSKRGAARVVRELVGTALNPVRGLQRMISGDMFLVDHQGKGKRISPEPYHFELGIGDRWIAEDGIHPDFDSKYNSNIPALDFYLDYGDHFNKIDGGKSHAFDKFELYGLLNIASKNPTFGVLEINGRIASSQHSTPSGWDLDWGFYQNYKYVEDYWKDGELRGGNLPVISEAASFGGALYAQKEGKTTTLSNMLMLSAVPMGCSTADYYTSPKNFGIDELPDGTDVGKRKYNYGSGFSIRENLTAHLNKRITLGDRFYLLQLYIFNGYDPKNPVVHHNSVMGDKGNALTVTNTLFAHVNLTQSLKLKVEYMNYLRKGVYDYYPNHTGKSHELKTTLAYSM